MVQRSYKITLNVPANISNPEIREYIRWDLANCVRHYGPVTVTGPIESMARKQHKREKRQNNLAQAHWRDEMQGRVTAGVVSGRMIGRNHDTIEPKNEYADTPTTELHQMCQSVAMALESIFEQDGNFDSSYAKNCMIKLDKLEQELSRRGLMPTKAKAKLPITAIPTKDLVREGRKLNALLDTPCERSGSPDENTLERLDEIERELVRRESYNT